MDRGGGRGGGLVFFRDGQWNRNKGQGCGEPEHYYGKRRSREQCIGNAGGRTGTEKHHGGQTLFVVLSGHAEFDYIKRALPMGILDYLLKPVTAQELEPVLEKVRNYLRESRNSRLMEELHSAYGETVLEEGGHHVALICLGTVPGCTDRGTFPAVRVWSDLDYEKFLEKNIFLQHIVLCACSSQHLFNCGGEKDAE